MQEANERTVLGDFADARFSDGAVNARFFRKSGQYRVRTDGPDGRAREFPRSASPWASPAAALRGAMPGGRFQVLGIAWDSRPAAAGGQRWFHLQTRT